MPAVAVEWSRRAGGSGWCSSPTGLTARSTAPAYVFCVLEQFHRHLLRRDIYARSSARWGDPRAKLLTGPVGAGRAPALTALRLPEDPTSCSLSTPALDAAWRALGDG